MQKFLVLVFLSLNISGLSAYTDLIIILEKGDKRFILIGDRHEGRTFVQSEQEPFFAELVKKLNKTEQSQPGTVVLYHEGLYGMEKFINIERSWLQQKLGPSANPLDFTPNTDPKALINEEDLVNEIAIHQKAGNPKAIINSILQHSYSYFTRWWGKTLATMRYKHDHAFTVENYDIREIGTEEAPTVENRRAIYQTIVDSILEDTPHYRTAYEKIPAPPQTDNAEEQRSMLLTKTGAAAMDLGLMEKLNSLTKSYFISIVHAGRAHIEFLTNLLQVDGWQVIDNLETTNPRYWGTSDPYLGEELKLFPFFPKTIDKATQKQIESDIAEAIKD
jgi:hypothetical protein